MADYWKSNAKKYCEICKCWFADNKISVENHERGLRHKGMVQARLRELSKKASERDKQNEQLAATLARMEQAAVMSMGGNSDPGFSNFKIDGATIGPSLGAAMYSGGSTMNALPQSEKLSKYEEAKQKVKAEKERIKELKKTAKKSTIWQETEEQAETPNESETIQWVKATSEDGQEYYFNLYTGGLF